MDTEFVCIGGENFVGPRRELMCVSDTYTRIYV